MCQSIIMLQSFKSILWGHYLVEIYCLPKRQLDLFHKRICLMGPCQDCGVDKFVFCPIEISIERLVQRCCIRYVDIIKSFSSKMKTKLPFHELLDAFGIIYPSYWLQKGVETSFSKHLAILEHYYVALHCPCYGTKW